MNLDKLKEAARKYEQKEDWRRAIEIYLKAIQELGSGSEAVDPSLYNRVGDLEMKAGDSAAALRAYEQAAEVYAEQGFYNNAIALCGKILRVNPGRVHTYLRLAQLHARKNVVTEAKRNLLEFIERMHAMHQLDDAFKAVEVFADQFSHKSEIRVMLSELLRASSRTQEASEQLEKLAENIESAGGASSETPPSGTAKPAGEGSGGRASRQTDLIFLDTGITPGHIPGFGTVLPSASASSESLVAPAESEEPSVELDPAAGIDDLVTTSVEDRIGLDPPMSDPLEGLDPTVLSHDAETLIGADAIDVEIQQDTPIFDPVDVEGDIVDGLESTLLEPFAATDEWAVPTVPDPGAEFDTGAGSDVDYLDIEGQPETPELALELDEDLPPAAPADAAPVVPPVPETEDAPFDSVEDEPPAAPPDPADYLARARSLLDQGDLENGVVALEGALELFTHHQRWDDALSTADDLIRLQPDDVRRYQVRVELAYRSGNRDRLIRSYLDLGDALVRVDAVPSALTVYARVLEHDPENQVARNALASLAAPPPDPPPPPAPSAPPAPPAPPVPPADPASDPRDDFVDLGALILDKEPVRDTRMRVETEQPIGDEDKDFLETLSHFKRGIEENIDSEDFQAHYDLGIAFKEMGLLDEAIAQFQKALRTPDGRLKGSASEALGIAFYDKGRFGIAETVLRRAVESLAGGDDEKIGLIYWLGRALEGQQRNADALRYYERALAVDIRFLDLSDRMTRLSAEGGAR